MRIAVLASVARRTPPLYNEPREKFIWLLTEGLVERNYEVTLFATRDSITRARLEAVVDRGYEESSKIEAEVARCLHLANLMEKADEFDIIHNNFGFQALSFSELIRTPFLTTIDGPLSKNALTIYKKYNLKTFYIAVSQVAKFSELDYLATIYPGIDLEEFVFQEKPGEYLLFCDTIDNDHGTREAIEMARRAEMKLIIAGYIQDKDYFEQKIRPELDGDKVRYVGCVEQPEKTKLLSSAYALLHPINYDEPFSYSVIEAMACGTPIIAFRKGAVPEMVIDGRTGFILDNIEEAVSRIRKVKGLSRADCRHQVETKFSLRKMLEEYVSIYQKVAEGTLGRGHKGLRPWGRFIVLEEKEKHKVKRIEVREGKRLSYQRHRRRSEHWFILQGKALVTIDGQEALLSPGEAIDIPVQALHRIEAKEGNVVFIEVQRGNYLGEDDVERVDDDFGRL